MDSINSEPNGVDRRFFCIFTGCLAPIVPLRDGRVRVDGRLERGALGLELEVARDDFRLGLDLGLALLVSADFFRECADFLCDVGPTRVFDRKK